MAALYRDAEKPALAASVGQAARLVTHRTTRAGESQDASFGQAEEMPTKIWCVTRRQNGVETVRLTN